MKFKNYGITAINLASFAVVLMLFCTSSCSLYSQEKLQISFGIRASFDFEELKAGVKIPWSTWQKIPWTILSDGGATGMFYLRVGPSTIKDIGAYCEIPFTVGKESWVGFSARAPGGGTLTLLIWDTRRRENVSHQVSLPTDGSWATFLIPLHQMGIEPGTRINNVGFFLGNSNREERFLDLDNVVIGTGRDIPAPSVTVRKLSASFRDNTACLQWQSPSCPTGIYRYRIYKGLYPDFPRDAKHLYAETQKNSFCDKAFVHIGEYFYTVRILDFAGNESPDPGAVRIIVE